MCADTDLMTDASVAKPTFVHKSGKSPEQLEAGKPVKYPESNTPVKFEATLTPKEDEPVQITKFKLKSPQNVKKFRVVLFNKKKKVVGVIRSPKGPVKDDVSTFINKQLIIKIIASVSQIVRYFH